MTNKRVVVTGMGAVTPVGNNQKDFWAAVLAGKSGAGPITRFDPSAHKTRFACEVKDMKPEEVIPARDLRRLDRFVIFAMLSSMEAVADSGLDPEKEDLTRIGVIIGSGIGGIEVLEEQHEVYLTKGASRVSPLMIPRMIGNLAPGHVSIKFGFKGPNSCPVTACASGTHAIGDAFKIIQRGHAVACLAGGTEAAVTPLSVAGFENMKALSSRNDSPETASRPFDRERDGFVIGEGAGILFLEEYEHAKARGANIYCEVAGYGMTGDAHHMTAPAPEGEGAARSMRMALDDAGMNPEDIQYINAHGTSTPMNDKNESQAIQTVFGASAKKVAVSSTKSMTGHLLGAAGGIEGVIIAKAIAEGRIPPTTNYATPDPECTLDYVPNEARELPVTAAMSNSLGFGGHNTTILFKKAG